jgi:hypothetical protein
VPWQILPLSSQVLSDIFRQFDSELHDFLGNSSSFVPQFLHRWDYQNSLRPINRASRRRALKRPDVLQRLKRKKGRLQRWGTAATSGSQAERPVDEPVPRSDVTFLHPPNLPLANPMHRLVTLNRPPRTTELTKMLLSPDPLLDRAMILLQDVVQILSRTVPATPS